MTSNRSKQREERFQRRAAPFPVLPPVKTLCAAGHSLLHLFHSLGDRRHPMIVLLAAIALTQTVKAADAPKPNILFILMDNLGYGEVGCYGGGIVRGAATPR